MLQILLAPVIKSEVYDLSIGFHQNEILHNATTDIELRWHFIPSRSPDFGGLWKAVIKSIKHHLYRTLGKTHEN